jgi:septal ring factor EnvC (AmiA/AmiB activator)
MIQLLRKYLTPHFVLTLVLCVFAVVFWVSLRAERKQRFQMEAELKTQQAIIIQQQKEILAADQRIKERDEASAKQVATLEKVKAKPPSTPDEAAKQIAQYLQLPTIPKFVPPPSLSVPAFNPVPSSLVFTPPEVEALRKAAIECSEVKVKLDTCTKDQDDRNAKIADLETQIKALTAQRNIAVRTVRGGTLVQRVWHTTKVALISGGVGAAIVFLAHR